MTLHIRPASAADAAVLSDLESAVFATDRLSPRSFRRLAEAPGAIMLVAEDDRSVAGYCIVLTRSGSDVARLYSLAAAPGRRGVGRLLLAGAETAAGARGLRRMRLEVRDDNARARDLYERAGYVRFAQVQDYYADGAAAIRYQRWLEGAAPAEKARRGSSRGTAAPPGH
jgi:ribosomal protein S18 acetylase RimI-like enzyme